MKRRLAEYRGRRGRSFDFRFLHRTSPVYEGLFVTILPTRRLWVWGVIEAAVWQVGTPLIEITWVSSPRSTEPMRLWGWR